MNRKILHISCLLVMALLMLNSCSREENRFCDSDIYFQDGFTIHAVSQNLLEQQIVTRSVIQKEEEEQKIKQLYLFFFDEQGNYIKSKNTQIFNGYWTPGSYATSISVPSSALPDGQEIKARVYAVANVEPNTFADEDKDGFPDVIKNENDLKTFVYTPRGESSRSIFDLPTDGMPMFGQWKSDNGSDELINLKESGKSITVSMKALMARVDMTIQLRPTEKAADGSLPSLSLNELEFKNLPKRVPFAIPGSSNLNGDKRSVIIKQTNIIDSKDGQKISFKFYMFENLQEAQADKTTGKIPADYPYPEKVSSAERQRWKPLFANEDATSITLNGYYTTYTGTTTRESHPTYQADFTLYLGANHTDNFKVARNRHYQNDLYIEGITQAGNNPEHVSFDARLNVSEQGNPLYISLLRYEHDAHINVVPMDVFFFRREDHPKVKVKILDAQNKPWLRMEKIPADNMAEGTVPDNNIDIYFAVHEPWAAGNGLRNYFTTDLMEDLKNNTEYELSTHRDRIYFYMDENVSTKERTVTIEVSYTDDNNLESSPIVRDFVFTQLGLLKVDVYDDNINEVNLKETIYIEQIEEYRDYADPLSKFDSQQRFEGLRWGDKGIYMGSAWSDDWANVYFNGVEATQNIVNKYGLKVMPLRSVPRSAAEYCYNKNKRNPDNHEAGQVRWFLPGIRELEAILTTYYNKYPEFREDFYWSSAAGKRKRVISYYEDADYARATRAFGEPVSIDGESFYYAPSDWDNIYDGVWQGKAPRETSLRIRTAFKPAAGEVVE